MPERKGKILFYYHHFGGLGHGTRVAAICKALRKIGHCEVLVVNSGKKQPELGLEAYAQVINLPPFEAESGLFSGLKAQEELDARFAKRQDILKRVGQAFRPDVAVFEHFPFGRASLAQEIYPFIDLLQEMGCRIYSSVRDIIDQPVDAAELNSRLNIFDGILVHADKDMGFLADFGQSQEFKNKFFLTGRVSLWHRQDLVDREVIRRRFNVTGRKWIVIGAGGGIDGEKLIERLIGLKEAMDKKVSSIFFIATGPNIGPEHLERLQVKAQGRQDIVLAAFDPDYVQYVNAADLSISMGGYNSVNNALLTGTPTMIFPRTSDGEQKKRAEYFRQYFEVMDEAAADEEIVEKVLRCLEKPRFVHPFGMNGAQATARLLDVATTMESMKVRLDTECNLFCEMCSWKKQTLTLSKEAFYRSILRARMVGVRNISVTGGEATMVPGIRDILKFIKDSGLKVALSTNGIVERTLLDSLLPYVDTVDISMDSADPKLHDRIRGKVGAFHQTMGTIRYLAGVGLKPHINVTVRPDNFIGLRRMPAMFEGCIDTISFGLVDTNMIKKRTERYIFSDEQINAYYFGELVQILKECVKHKLEAKIQPIYGEFESKDTKYILTKFLSAQEEYRARFREIFNPNNQSCSIPRRYLRVNPMGELVFCCYQDDSGVDWGNMNRTDLCDIVVSDKYFNFVHNAVEGKEPCGMCKKSYKTHYGGQVACEKSA